MQELSSHQKRTLLSNPNVDKITAKQVIYTAAFKIRAVKQYLKGQKPDEIFKANGIEPVYFIDNYCRFCIKRWKKKYFDKGKESLKSDRRGSGATGRPKKENPDELTYQELVALVEIQQDVIDALKKKKALAKKK